jgi:ribosomal protein L18E
LIDAQLYRFLARRTDSPFNKAVLKRLYMSRVNRPPLSISKLTRFMNGKEDKTAVIVGTVTDDKRMFKTPKLTVCALRFTSGARARIVKAGGMFGGQSTKKELEPATTCSLATMLSGPLADAVSLNISDACSFFEITTWIVGDFPKDARLSLAPIQAFSCIPP